MCTILNSPLNLGKTNLKPILIILILAVGVLLRIWPGPEYILYTYDQGRDALAAQSILSGDLKIIGPQTDISGLFHGPLGYYLPAIPYELLGGLPGAVYFHIFTNLLTLIPLYFLAKYLFLKKRTALLACFLFLISFEQVSYARWFSHAALIIPTSAVFYLGLYMIHLRKGWGIAIAAIGAGASVQLELLTSYFLPAGLLFLVIFKPRLKLKNYILGFLIIFLFLSTYLIAEVKFNFMGVRGLFAYLEGQSTGFDLLSKLGNYASQLQNLAAYNLAPQSKPLSTLIFVAVIVAFLKILWSSKFAKNYLFLLFILLANLPLFFLLGLNSHFINMGTSVPFILILALVLDKLKQRSRVVFILVIALLTYCNVSYIFETNSKGNLIFQVQSGMVLQDAMELVTRTYQIASGGTFSINAVTNPLFIPTKWAYLYKQYAYNNQTQLPHFHGNTASVFPGLEIFPRSGEITDYEFTIVEPELPEEWTKRIIESDDSRKKALFREVFGKMILIVRH